MRASPSPWSGGWEEGRGLCGVVWGCMVGVGSVWWGVGVHGGGWGCMIGEGGRGRGWERGSATAVVTVVVGDTVQCDVGWGQWCGVVLRQGRGGWLAACGSPPAVCRALGSTHSCHTRMLQAHTHTCAHDTRMQPVLGSVNPASPGDSMQAGTFTVYGAHVTPTATRPSTALRCFGCKQHTLMHCVAACAGHPLLGGPPTAWG